MGRILAPFRSTSTNRELLFLLTALPFGVAWIALLLVGWVFSIVLVITPLVIPVLITFGVFVGLAARAERGLGRALLDARSYDPQPHSTDEGPLRRARDTITNTASWRTQSYLLLRFLGGAPMAVAMLAILGAGLLLTTAPIHYRWIPQDHGTHGIDFGFWQADTLPETALLMPVGLALLIVGANLIGPLATLWRRLAYGLLGGSMTDVDHRPLTEAQLRRGLAIHALVSASINVLLIIIWALTGAYRFWPMWTLLALGLPLGIHAWVVLVLIRPGAIPGRLGRAFAIHAGVSIAIAVFLTLIWLITGRGYFFWPVWPILGLAVPVFAHLAVILMSPRNAELERRIDVLTTTRAGAVNAQEEELRRIERDLHDGAQARLVALGMSLGMAEQKLAADPDSARELLVEARQGAREALEELRDLARGIHPPILADRGLGAAVSALAARSPVRVNVSIEGERPPAAIESAAYFVAAEALANATKHAHPTHVDIRVMRDHGRLVVEVVDDGQGGADPTGAGLSGLRRRVEALDGRLQVVSPPGGPTMVRAELPCE